MKRKYTRHVKTEPDEVIQQENQPIEVEDQRVPEPEPEPTPPPVEEKVKLCDCGNPANPGDHQCWRCSHRT